MNCNDTIRNLERENSTYRARLATAENHVVADAQTIADLRAELTRVSVVCTELQTERNQFMDELTTARAHVARLEQWISASDCPYSHPDAISRWYREREQLARPTRAKPAESALTTKSFEGEG